MPSSSIRTVRTDNATRPVRRSSGGALRAPGEHARHPRCINGLTDYECRVRRRVPPAQSRALAALRDDGGATLLEFRALLPGSVLALRVSPRGAHAAALAELERALAPARAGRSDPLALGPALADLDLADFNALLYRCDAEEREAGGGGVYDVPGHGPLVYAGLQVSGRPRLASGSRKQ